jgi:hypothetical protein
MSTKYQKVLRHEIEPEEGETTFFEHVIKSYRKTYDRLLIASKVCSELHNKPDCEIPDKLWDENVD